MPRYLRDPFPTDCLDLQGKYRAPEEQNETAPPFRARECVDHVTGGLMAGSTIQAVQERSSACGDLLHRRCLFDLWYAARTQYLYTNALGNSILAVYPVILPSSTATAPVRCPAASPNQSRHRTSRPTTVCGYRRPGPAPLRPAAPISYCHGCRLSSDSYNRK